MTGAIGAMAEQSTTAMQYPLGLMQSVPSDELERRRKQYIRDTMERAGITTRRARWDGEELLVAYERLAARRAAERTQE